MPETHDPTDLPHMAGPGTYAKFVVVALLVCAAATSTFLAFRTSPKWEPVWADEFQAPSIDSGNWTAEVMPDPFNEELQYYTDRIDDMPGSNAWIEDGVLIIEARAERFKHRRYTSSRLVTKGKREFFEGRFEARMRLPGEKGMWPAFWLLGGNIDTVGWPRCGEIDIMEGKGRLRNWISGALHRGLDPGRNIVTSEEYVLPEGDFHSQWHVFSVEWDKDEIRWYVDDIQYQVRRRPPGSPDFEWPFGEGHGFFIILNLAVGGWFDKPHLPANNLVPQRLYVDYVRVFRRAGD